MSEINVKNLSLDQLKQLQKDISNAFADYQEREKVEARAKVEAFAKELGFSLAELVRINGKKRFIPAGPKYRNPEEPTLTWSGLGRRPHWFLDLLASGKTLEELTIDWENEQDQEAE